MTKGWKEAARKYRRSRTDERIEQASQELASFMSSLEGEAALELLSASGRCIIFGRERRGEVGDDIYLLSKAGLVKIFASNSRISGCNRGRYLMELTDSEAEIDGILISATPIIAREAVGAAVKMSSWGPDRVVSRLRDRLNVIASTAPK